MIYVEVYTKESNILKIEISGHAYSGEPGYDLVCAGVSSIAVGALNGFEELECNCNLEMTEDPFIKIECRDLTETNQLLMNFLFLQLKTVEESHHEHIKINVKEESQ